MPVESRNRFGATWMARTETDGAPGQLPSATTVESATFHIRSFPSRHAVTISFPFPMIPAALTPRLWGAVKDRTFIIKLVDPGCLGSGWIEYILADMSIDVVRITSPLGNYVIHKKNLN